MFRYLRKRRAYRSTFFELSRLTTRELNDIGIGPGDIDRIAHDVAESV